ncbi:MAG: hypothetical protein HY658_08595, partial [Actinobacteria bacterium]|nr:hypothetical protein [Actinomycetota bacterium]
RRGLAVLAALVAIVGLALLLLAGVTGPDDTGRDPSAALPRTSPSAASASPGESPSPSPSPSTPEELLALALADLDRTVAEGVSSGEVSEKAADEISKRVEEALGELEEGKGEEALERLADLEQKVWEMLEKGEITSEDRAAAIVGALEDVEDAVLAFAPGQGDDGSEGPPEDNPGQGDGKGKGNDEDDD